MANFRVSDRRLTLGASDLGQAIQRWSVASSPQTLFDYRRDEVSADGGPLPARLPTVRHLSILLTAYETGAPLRGVPIYAIATVLAREPGGPSGEGVLVRGSLPLGMVGTDHCGYASWDLTRSGRRLCRGARRFAGERQEGDVPEFRLFEGNEIEASLQIGDVQILDLRLLLWGDPFFEVAALEVGDVARDRIVVRHQLDERELEGRELEGRYVSMQSPSLLDWEISPSSFTLSTGQMIGEDGCESFLPPLLSTQQFNFSSLVLDDAPLPQSGGSTDETDLDEVRLGYLYEYTTEWFHIGHSLGSLINSLALAPGEKVRLAVVEWSRADNASRGEAQRFSESLEHRQRRDRDVNETMKMALNEVQRGSSLQGGLGLSAGGAVVTPMGAATAVFSGALSAVFGGSSNQSEGHRDLSGQNMQHVTDAMQQASSALRELSSTVVTELRQGEASSAQTRVVANYNHGHTLTILYYQVMRHFRVLTRHVRTRPVLMVKGPKLGRFTQELNITLPGVGWGRTFVGAGVINALNWRHVLEPALLDATLSASFDALSRVARGVIAFRLAESRASAQPVKLGGLLERKVVSFDLKLKVKQSVDEDAVAYMRLRTKDDHFIAVRNVGKAGDGSEEQESELDLVQVGENLVDSREYSYSGLVPQQSLTLGQLKSVQFSVRAPTETGFDMVSLYARLEGDEWWTLLEKVGPSVVLLEWNEDGEAPVSELIPTLPEASDGKSQQTSTPTLAQFLSADDLTAADILISHLNQHQSWYHAVLRSKIDSASLTSLLNRHAISGTSVAGLVDARAVGACQEWVVLPIAPGARVKVASAFGRELSDEVVVPGVVVEDLVSLPARGVFAEAKLGHCNANELIDNRRFWDWQTSPIPDDAPALEPVSTASRYQAPTGLSTSTMPGALVNIVSPATLPDPVGLAAGLKLLGTADIFRNMSGGAELSGLLGRLADDSSGLAKALAQAATDANSQRTIQSVLDNTSLTPDQKSKLLQSLLGTGTKGNAETPAQESPAKKTPKEEESSPTSSPTNQGGDSKGTAKPTGGGGAGGGGGKSAPSGVKPSRGTNQAKQGVVLQVTLNTNGVDFDPTQSRWILTAHPEDLPGKSTSIDEIIGASMMRSLSIPGSWAGGNLVVGLTVATGPTAQYLPIRTQTKLSWGNRSYVATKEKPSRHIQVSLVLEAATIKASSREEAQRKASEQYSFTLGYKDSGIGAQGGSETGHTSSQEREQTWSFKHWAGAIEITQVD